MKNFKVKKAHLSGTIVVPSSKSHTLRAILFATLAEGVSHLQHCLHSPDTFAMISACESLGAEIEVNQNELIIKGISGNIQTAPQIIDAGNSGIVLRFLTGVLATTSQTWTITGDRSICTQRTMKDMIKGLLQLGVDVQSQNGFAPIHVTGPIKKYFTELSGEDSQPISGLLIAGTLLKTPLEIQVSNPGEKPWVQMTLNWLDRLGITYTNDHYHSYRVNGSTPYKNFSYKVPGDWSSAAFPIVAALITNSEIQLENIDFKDCQGDKVIVQILESMGAVFIKDEDLRTLQIKKGAKLKGRVIDMNDCIDAITILAVLGCFVEGETHLINAGITQFKECNRLVCITQELKKMGADIQQTEERLVIRQSSLKAARVSSHQDHRMAMSLIVAGMGAEGMTEVLDVDCINKTFPDFLQKFQALQAIIET